MSKLQLSDDQNERSPLARLGRGLATGAVVAGLTLGAVACSDDDGNSDDIDNPVDGVDDQLDDGAEELEEGIDSETEDG